MSTTKNQDLILAYWHLFPPVPVHICLPIKIPHEDEDVDPNVVCPVYKKKRPQNLDKRSRTYETNITACRARCGALTKCVYWSYWDDHGCHLSGGEPLITVDEHVTTGKNPKLCGK